MTLQVSSLLPGARSMGAALASIGLATLAACGSGDGASSAQSAAQMQQEQPPAPVKVMVAEPAAIGTVRSVTGRAVPYSEAEIRPQVTGLIQTRLFTEGETVAQGQELYKIDPSEYAAAVESAQAAVARAEASAETAGETAKRFERLAEINAVSQQAYDEAVATHKQAQAEVGIQRAALERARIDLGRTRMRAPIDGQIGRSSVTPGALVTANQAQPLARIVQLDPIYIDMTVASRELLRWKQDVAAGNIRTDEGTGGVPVTVRFENGTEYPQRGTLEFSEVSVDSEAGTVIVRAQVPNPDGLILPGMFVEAEFTAGTYDAAYLIPQRAVQRTPKGEAMAFVIGDEGKAEQRMLVLQEARGADWVVTGGIEPGDRIIIDGLQNVRAGAAVSAISGDPAQEMAMKPGNSDITPE